MVGHSLNLALDLALAATLLAASVAHAVPSAPPPTPIDICRDRSSLLFLNAYLFEIRPCTIKAGAKGRTVELASTGGPASFRQANGKQQRPAHLGLGPGLRARRARRRGHDHDQADGA